MCDNESIWDNVTILRKNNRQIKKNNEGNNVRNGNTETIKKQAGRGGEATKAFKLAEAKLPFKTKLIKRWKTEDES